MGKKTVNYGADIFFRRIRKRIADTFKALFAALALGITSALAYVLYETPLGTLPMIPDYAKALIRWHLRNEAQYRPLIRQFESRISTLESALKPALIIGSSIACIGTLILWLTFREVGRRSQRDTYLRGAQLITERKLQKQLFKEAKFTTKNGYFLNDNGLFIPEEYVHRGCTIAGRPGVGKSTTIRKMMKQDLNRFAKHFVVDLNGDYYRRFGRPGRDKILSLRHKASEYWDFQCEDVVPSLLASYLVAEATSGPSFWWKGARAVLASLFRNSTDLEDFKSKIRQSDGNILKLLNDNDELSAKVLGKEGSQQAAGILGNTVLDFSFIEDLGYWPKLLGKTKPFSITDWAMNTENDSWVYVIVREDELEEAGPLIACWFNLAVGGCLRRDEERAAAGEYPMIIFDLDELKSLPRLGALEKAGERLRKTRGAVVTGYHNNPQLEATYGVNGAKNLKDVLQNKIIFQVGDPDAQEELAKALGEQDIERFKASESFGKRDSDAHTHSREVVKKSIVMPSEIGSLRDHHCYVKIGYFDPIKLVIEHEKFPTINPAPEWELPPRRTKALDGGKEGLKTSSPDPGPLVQVSPSPAPKLAIAGLMPADPISRAQDVLQTIDDEEY